MSSDPRNDDSDNPERLAPTIVKEVLDRMAARKLAPTPESFTWMYRQAMRARNIPVGVQYTTEIDALRHALSAFEDLLVGNAWLAGRFKTLTAVADDTGRSTAERTRHVRIILDEIGANKEQALFQMARLVTETREAVHEMLLQVSELADRISTGRVSFGRAHELIQQCHDIDEFKGALRAIANDIRNLHRNAKRASTTVATSYGQFATSAPYLFGPPRTGASKGAGAGAIAG